MLHIQAGLTAGLMSLLAVLAAGLGQRSRSGGLILNPFNGLRPKPVLFTADLPLVADQSINFGLRTVCNRCGRCAREHPCNAIPGGPKAKFNGHEIWKSDVEKSGKYRLTNMNGAAWGRCMKTCLHNREDLLESERLLWLFIKVSAPRQPLINCDDRIGAGVLNPVKRWWLDLETTGGVAVAPEAGIDERSLNRGRKETLAAGRMLAYFPPALQAVSGTPVQTAVPVDRRAGLAACAAAESPIAARRRWANLAAFSDEEGASVQCVQTACFRSHRPVGHQYTAQSIA